MENVRDTDIDIQPSKSSSRSIPVIDLSSPDKTNLARQCAEACRTFGFFMVVGHAVPIGLVQQHADVQKRFFSQPLEEKMKIAADENNRGYTPSFEETLDPSSSLAGDAHEGLYFGREISPDAPESSMPLHGPNQWPSEDVLGGCAYRETVEKYMKAMTELGYRLLELLALSLELPKDHFNPYFDCPMTFLRPLKYLAIPSDEAGGRFAAGAHTDHGMLTILYTDGTPGLQIHVGGSWKDIHPIPGAFIINLGDMLHHWTGGRYSSTLHRVINPRGKERFSIAFFFEPSFDAVVEVLPNCRTSGWEQRFPVVTSGQHLLQKYRETHAGYS